MTPDRQGNSINECFYGLVIQGGVMGQTATYCSECYNKVGRTEDAQVKAAESEGKVPMTKQGTCAACAKATVVVYYE
jgi:hypothetical protein